jgi:phosphoribosylformylglycinamidine synthase I
MKSPDICILKTDGINCEVELDNALKVAGGAPEIVHINKIAEGSRRLEDYAALALPGGFSYGDGIASGVVLANEMNARLEDQLHEFRDAEKPVIGICNGFQVLARMGLLPKRELGEQSVSLTLNSSGHFQNYWVDLRVMDNICKFTPPESFDELITMQEANGEGRFVAREETADELTANGQVVFKYKRNTNGSMADIAGICDPTGTILGMMPHPERSVASMHPDRSRTQAARAAAAVIFENFVNYAREM